MSADDLYQKEFNNPLLVNPYRNSQHQLQQGSTTALTPTDYTGVELWAANQMYYYDPIIESIQNQITYGDRYDQEYNPLEDMSGYEQYAPHLIDARNQDHMDDLKESLDDNLRRRQVMGEASFGEHIVAGLLDPLNLVSFGGFGVPALAKGIASGAIRSTGQYMLKAAGRTALGTGALVAGLEGLSYPFDPLKTVQESAMNIAVGYAFGGAFGGLLGIPMGIKAGRAGKYHKAVEQMQETVVAFERMNITPEEIKVKLEVPEDIRNNFKELEINTTVDLEAYKSYIKGMIEYLDNGAKGAPPASPNKKWGAEATNIHTKGDDWIQKSLGEKYRIMQVITDPASVKAKKQEGGGWLGLNESSFGRDFSGHLFFKGARMWVDKLALQKKWSLMQKMKRDLDANPSVLPKNVVDLFDKAVMNKAFFKRITDKLKTATIEERQQLIGYMHQKYFTTQMEKGVIKNVDDFIDFVVLHELNHSKKGETMDDMGMANSNKRRRLIQDDNKYNLELEWKNNDLALKDLIEWQKKIKDEQQSTFQNGGTPSREALLSRKNKYNEKLKEIDEEILIRQLEDSHSVLTGQPKDPYSYAKSWLTDSWIYNKLLPTPFKNILQSKVLTDYLKEIGARLAHDKGMQLTREKHGMTTDPSVYLSSKQMQGEWVGLYMDLMSTYGLTTGKGVGLASALGHQGTNIGKKKILDTRPAGFQEWSTNANHKYIKGEKGADDLEQKAIDAYAKFYKDWEKRLVDTGLIGSKKYYTGRKMDLTDRIKETREKINEIDQKLQLDKGGLEQIKDWELTKKLLLEWAEINQKIIISQESVMKGHDTGLSMKETKRFNQIQAILTRMENTSRNKNISLLKAYHETVARQKNNLEETEAMLKAIDEDGATAMPRAEEVMFPRYWKRQEIQARRTEFETLLESHYIDHPEVIVWDVKSSKYLKVKLKPEEARDRAVKTVDGLLGMRDTTEESVSFFGSGKSKHFKHRTLDIPNAKVIDFIETDPFKVMKAYTDRVAPRYQFALKHQNRTYDEVMDDAFARGTKDGVGIDDLNTFKKDYTVLYDRIVGVVQRDPERWDNRLVQVLRDGAQLNYLGSAGLSTLPDFAKIMMEHDHTTVVKVIQSFANDAEIRGSIKEAKISGEIIDIENNAGGLRFSEALQNDPLTNGSGFWGRYDRATQEAKSAFYMMNLLAPMTKGFKSLDAMCRVHTMIDIAIKRASDKDAVNNNSLTQMELEYGVRYGIDAKKSKRYKELLDAGIITKTKNGLYIANTERWPMEYADLKLEFQANLQGGIMNTVLMGTPADLPQIVDGRVFIPMSVAKQFGMKEDLRVRGYAQMETGILAMPFQFFSYSFAAMNKITGAYAQGQVRNKAVALTAGMLTGYFSVMLKTKDYIWDEMTWEDKMARSFDQSGLLALVSDMYYTAMITSAKLGGPDLTGGLISPKFSEPNREGTFGQVSAVASDWGGAGFGWADSLFYGGLREFTEGNFGAGGKSIIRDLPFARLWFLKDFINSNTNELGKSYNGRF